ncbi:MAG: hypothetical protein ABI672_19300 [Vicinamibacteria bacterium]
MNPPHPVAPVQTLKMIEEVTVKLLSTLEGFATVGHQEQVG